jgi:hypothetical protein
MKYFYPKDEKYTDDEPPVKEKKIVRKKKWCSTCWIHKRENKLI